jgi:hypothetical protein
MRPRQLGILFGKVMEEDGEVESCNRHCTKTSFFQASTAILEDTSEGTDKQVQKQRCANSKSSHPK